MALWGSAELLAAWRDQFNRPSTDAAWDSDKVYRFLSRAQAQVTSDVAAVFPRLLMGEPHAMETTDGGYTYHSTIDDADGNPIHPFGHAEVYARVGGYDSHELFGSTYGGGGGDVVFEGNKVRLPRRWVRTFPGTLYLRCVQMPESISASAQPTLQPPFLRELIVYRACVLAANAGGNRDPGPYEVLYRQAWNGVGTPGSNGFLGLLHTQYRNSYDAALEGIAWWRWALSQGGLVGTTGING